MPDITHFFFSQCSWRSSFHSQSEEPKKNANCNKHNQTYFMGLYKFWVKKFGLASVISWQLL